MENKEEKECKKKGGSCWEGDQYIGACCTEYCKCECHKSVVLQNKEETCSRCATKHTEDEGCIDQSWPQTPDSKIEDYIKKGDTIQIKIDEVVANKYTPEWIKELVTLAHSSGRREAISKIQEFDIKYGIHGKPVTNPLMRLEDVKRFLIDFLLDKDLT